MTRALKTIKTAAFCIMAVALLLFASATAAWASESPYVLDHYNLLDGTTQAELETQAEDMASTYGVGTYLLIVDNIGSYSARDFAKGYWDYYDLGVGSEDSGILFLIAVDSRDYVTITHGQGVYNFTDYQIGQMEDSIVSLLSNDDWEGACRRYIELCSSTLQFTEENGEPLDYDNAPVDWSEKLPIDLAVAVVIALIVMFCVRSFLKGQLKSVAPGGNASAYLQGKTDITHSSEVHTGTTVSRTPIPKNDDSGHGGSSIDSGGFGGSSGGKF